MDAHAEDYVRDGEYLPVDAAPEINESVDPIDVVNTTQKLRIGLVKEQLKGGYRGLDDKSSSVLLQTLRDLDTAALTTRKIQVEERAADIADKVSNNAETIAKMFGNSNPFMVDPSSGVVRKDLIGSQPLDAGALPAIELVPGHTRQGTETLHYSEFVSDEEEAERAASLEDDEDDLSS